MLSKQEAGKWLIVKGGEALRGAVNKFIQGNIFAKNSFGAGGITAGVLVREIKYGNFIECTGAVSLQQLKFIKSAGLGLNFPVDEAGGFIFLSVANNSIVIKHNTAAPPAGSKTILNPSGQDITVAVGGMVLLIEDETAWKVVSVWDSANNYSAVYGLISVVVGLLNAETVRATAAEDLINGAWSSVNFSGANAAAVGATLSAFGGSINYKIMGKTIFINYLLNCTIVGGATSIAITLPLGKVFSSNALVNVIGRTSATSNGICEIRSSSAGATFSIFDVAGVGINDGAGQDFKGSFVGEIQ
jgi:hypothetical protein